MKRIEIAAILGVLTGFVFKVVHWPFANEILSVSVSVLCIIDIFGSVLLYQDIGLSNWLKDKTVLKKDLFKSIVFRLCGVSLALIWTGLLFSINIWAGADQFISYGLLMALFALGLVLRKINTKDKSYYEALGRLVPMIILALLFYLKPHIWIDYYYDHDHQARNLLRKMQTNPNDTSLSNQFQDRMKFYTDSCNNVVQSKD